MAGTAVRSGAARRGSEVVVQVAPRPRDGDERAGRDSTPARSSAEAYDAFYRACSARLSGQLYLLTGDREEARDCVQEALERAWTRWSVVSDLADPEAWVRTVARRLSVSRWRKARNGAVAWRRLGRADAVDAEDPGERDALVAALRQLTPEQRTAVVLHHLCDLDVAAVATETGVSVSTVTSRLSRGRSALHALLTASPASGTSPDGTRGRTT